MTGKIGTARVSRTTHLFLEPGVNSVSGHFDPSPKPKSDTSEKKFPAKVCFDSGNERFSKSGSNNIKLAVNSKLRHLWQLYLFHRYSNSKQDLLGNYRFLSFFDLLYIRHLWPFKKLTQGLSVATRLTRFEKKENNIFIL